MARADIPSAAELEPIECDDPDCKEHDEDVVITSATPTTAKRSTALPPLQVPGAPHKGRFKRARLSTVNGTGMECFICGGGLARQGFMELRETFLMDYDNTIFFHSVFLCTSTTCFKRYALACIDETEEGEIM